jgi:pimeloyl-ACP methyl ester carboxylesterase
MQGRFTGAVLRTARRRPGLVEGGRRIGSDLAWLITRRLSFADKSVDGAVVDFLHELISATPIEAIADFHATLMAHDGTAGLAAMGDVPVAVVVGDHDVMTPVAHSRRMAEALPQAELTIVADAGHLAMLERPELVDDAIAGLVDAALERAPAGVRGS